MKNILTNKKLIYIVFMLFDFIICTVLNYINLKKEKIKSKDIFKIIFLNLIGIIIGSKILDFYIFYNYYLKEDVLSMLFVGWMFMGGAIFSICLIEVYCYIKKYKATDILGIITKNLILFYGLGKIGCFMNGCCSGIEYNGTLNILNKIPLQILESIYCMCWYFYIQTNKISLHKKIFWYSLIALGSEKIIFIWFRDSNETLTILVNVIISIILISIGAFEIKNNNLQNDA